MSDIKSDKVFAEKVESFAEVIDALLMDEKTREMFNEDPLLALRKHGIEFEDEMTANQIERSLHTINQESFRKGRLGSNVSLYHPAYVVVAVVVVTENRPKNEFASSLSIDNERVETFLDITELKRRTAELEDDIRCRK